MSKQFLLRIYRPIVFTLILGIYSLIITAHLLVPGGIINKSYKMYRQNKIYKYEISRANKRYTYYRNLLLMARGGDKDAIALLSYKKFRVVFQGYKIYRSNITNNSQI